MKYLSEQFSSFDRHLALEAFTEGRSFGAWKFFGAHPDKIDGAEGYSFLLWAPNAAKVCLMGDFNQWNNSSHPLNKLEGGLWELFVPNLVQYDSYKFAIHTQDGRVIAKADPYAFHAETRPNTASKLYPMTPYPWNDQGWQTHKEQTDPYHAPLNIYECHLGSWRRGAQGEYLDYRTIATLLVPYLKEMGYTHVELMPVTEHPLDDSWGYQVTGYFAATSRFGTPDDLKYLIDQLHQGGIGVILDWVPAHFPRDEFGLFQFDGTPTYEYQSLLKGEHPQWGTNCFDLGRNEVKSFLFSSAMFWLEEFHADGLRVDAVSSMLYLNFGREDADWQPNIHGGEENLEAISFLQELNTNIFKQFPTTMMVAEEATSWPQVTSPVADGGLGFNFKWNMGWMNDLCHYIKLDPLARQHHHKDLTFALMYAFNENYVLPISHDEVVHKKSSYLGKMQGDTFQKLSSSRAFYVYIMTHPGKKLTFMGAEIGQWGEWAFEHSLDWHLMEFDDHKNLNHFHKETNRMYLNEAPLWEKDTSWDGFLWLCADDNLGNTLAYARWDSQGNPLVVVCNFSPVHRNGYRLPLPKEGIWQERFNSDWSEFGGANHRNEGNLQSEAVPCYGQDHSMEINLPPNSSLVFRFFKEGEQEPALKLVDTLTPATKTRKKTVKLPKPSKSTAAPSPAVSDTPPLGEVAEAPKKRGRKKTTPAPAETAEVVSAPPKPRGRPKKVVAPPEPVAEPQPEPTPEAPPAPKPRGRRKKADSAPVDEPVSIQLPPVQASEEESKPTKGRPRKQTLTTPPRKRGRPKKD